LEGNVLTLVDGQKMFFLVTGGLGYLGGRLVDHLLKEGHRVRVTTRRPPDSFPEWAKEWEIAQIAGSEKEEWLRTLEGIDLVFHLAAPDAASAAADPVSAFRAGGEMTWSLLEAISGKQRRPRIINVSTYHVYGPNVGGVITESSPVRPIHPYSVGLMLSEMTVQVFCHVNGISALNVRLSNSFGKPIASSAAKWSLVFNDLCRQAATSNTLRLNSAGYQKRNFITIEDTVAALLFIADRRENWPDDHIIHIGSNNYLSIRDVAEHIAERCKVLWGRSPEIVIPEEGPGIDDRDFIFDISRLEKLGFIWSNRIDFEIDSTLKACMEWNSGI